MHDRLVLKYEESNASDENRKSFKSLVTWKHDKYQHFRP